MRWLLLAAAATAALAGCGSGDDGRPVFERAERGLARADALRVQLAVHALMSVDRTATIAASELSLERLHLARWARHPRIFGCGHSFECARADFDAEAAARELEPALPDLPFDPAAIESATIEVRLDSRGELKRIDLRGELSGADVEVDLRPT
jgi:hypothetical protein